MVGLHCNGTTEGQLLSKRRLSKMAKKLTLTGRRLSLGIITHRTHTHTHFHLPARLRRLTLGDKNMLTTGDTHHKHCGDASVL